MKIFIPLFFLMVGIGPVTFCYGQQKPDTLIKVYKTFPIGLLNGDSVKIKQANEIESTYKKGLHNILINKEFNGDKKRKEIKVLIEEKNRKLDLILKSVR